MYLVKIYDGPNDVAGTVIHSPTISKVKLTSGVIKKEVAKIDSFDMALHYANPGYGKIKPFRTLVNVLNTKTNRYEFEGRVLIPTDDMRESGEISNSFVCEGEMAYLHDAPQRHLEFRGTVYELVKTQLDYFNEQVEPYKRFEVGNVTVTDPNDSLYLYLSAEDDTFESLQKALIDRLGGEFQIRKENGIRYLDYVPQIGTDSNVEIKLARNLLSISKTVDPTTVVTRLTPLGTRIESTDETATDASEARLTIADVNNGRPYIDRPDLIALFGIQGGSIVWDDVTLSSNLKTKGTEYINNQKAILYQHTVDAIDLFKVGMETEQFEVGNTHPVKNRIMAIDERLRIIGKTIDINEPERNSLVIGDKFKGANEYQADLNRSNKRVLELQNTVSRQMRLIGNLSTGYAAVSQDIETVQTALNTIDVDNLPTELQELNQTLEDIQQAVSQLPTYSIVTPTTDGLMSSVDKVSLDKVVTDTGDLSLLDTADKTSIVTAINELVARIETLENTP